MSAFVIDTSVTMAWCFEDESTGDTDAILDRLSDDRAVVPAIWPLEVANVLIVAERRGRVTEAQANRFIGLLQQLPLDTDESPTDMAALVAAAGRHQLSSYDASYLVLAERLGMSLATRDVRLVEAALRAGVPLLLQR